jgi:hypothetical protein
MKRSKNEGDGGTDIYMREGTTSRVTVDDRPCSEIYDFYVTSEYFWRTLLYVTPLVTKTLTVVTTFD